MLSVSSSLNLRAWSSFLSTAHRNSRRNINLWHKNNDTTERHMQAPGSSEQAVIRRKQDYQDRVRASRQARGEVVDTGLVRLSKQLSYVLRHGAKKEGLSMRVDGYARVQDLLALPRFQTLDFLRLERIVQEDAKMRYHLLLEPDQTGTSSDIWWIRANQGHTMKDVELDMTELTDPGQVPMAVHGTSLNAWKSIQHQGLSRMARHHIHFAQGLAGGKGSNSVISGMRSTSQILIYIDLPKALDAGLKFYVSHNAVVLSPGDENGFIKPEFFRRVEGASRKPLEGWTGIEEQFA